MFLLHFLLFRTFLFLGHSKIKVRSCVLCVYAGMPWKRFVPLHDDSRPDSRKVLCETNYCIDKALCGTLCFNTMINETTIIMQQTATEKCFFETYLVVE